MNTDLTDRILERSSGLPGFLIHIPCHINISKTATIETGIGLISKNTQVYRVGQYFGAYENSINQFLQIPVVFKVSIWQANRFKLVAGPGFYSAFWFSSTRKGKIFNLYNSEINLTNGQSELLLSLSAYEEKRNLREQGYNRFEVGGILSSTIQYMLSPSSSLVCDANFMRAFNGKQAPSLGKKLEYNTTFVFSFGFLKSL